MKRNTGFTLLELMIVVAIVAILASVALPSYTEHMRKSRRADAQAFAQDVVARQQQVLLDRRAYASSITAAVGSNGLGLSIPSNVSSFYSVTMTAQAGPPPAFVVTLTPTGGQASDTSCGEMTINQAGVKTDAKTRAGTGSCW